MSLWDYIAIPFGWLLLTLYNLVGNYGIAVFLFALVGTAVALLSAPLTSSVPSGDE